MANAILTTRFSSARFARRSRDVDLRELAVLQELSSDELNVADLRWLNLRSELRSNAQPISHHRVGIVPGDTSRNGSGSRCGGHHDRQPRADDASCRHHRRSVGTGAHDHHCRRWLRDHSAQTNDPADARPDHGIVSGLHADPVGRIESDGPPAPSDGVACGPRVWFRRTRACHFGSRDGSHARCRQRICRSEQGIGIRLGARNGARS